jgi:hypothetical protein
LDKYTHQIIDNLFEKYYGWKARSSSVFVEGENNPPNYYGDNIWAFFAIGNFDYLWSIKNIDFLMTSNKIKSQIPMLSIEKIKTVEEYKEKLKKIIKEDYILNNNLKIALEKHPYNEIMVKCKEYYLIQKNFYLNNIKGKL